MRCAYRDPKTAITRSRRSGNGFHLYASKAYLETVPSAEWTFIGYDEHGRFATTTAPLERAGGRAIAVRSSVLAFQAAWAGWPAAW